MLYRKKRKSLQIKVYPEGMVEVLAPLTLEEEKILEKTRAKAPWILKQLDFFNLYKPLAPPRRYISGETHLYLGRQYRLKIVLDNKHIVKAYRGQLWIHSPNITPEILKIQLNEWYKQRAIIIFNDLLKEILPRFNRYKIKTPLLIVRQMSKRWGSCTATGKIILNTELVKAHKGCIEYVLVHEMCHLVFRNHTKAFQSLQSRILPDWQKWKNRLEHSLH